MWSRNETFFLWLGSVGGFLFLFFSFKAGSLVGMVIGGVAAVTCCWIGARQMHGVHHHYHHGRGADASPGSGGIQPYPQTGGHPPAGTSPFAGSSTHGHLPDREAVVKRRYVVREEAEVVFVPADMPPQLRALFDQSQPPLAQPMPSRPIMAVSAHPQHLAIESPKADALTAGGVAKMLLLGPAKRRERA